MARHGAKHARPLPRGARAPHRRPGLRRAHRGARSGEPGLPRLVAAPRGPHGAARHEDDRPSGARHPAPSPPAIRAHEPPRPSLDPVRAGRRYNPRNAPGAALGAASLLPVPPCSGGRSGLDLEYDDAVGGCERGLRRGVERFEVEVVALGDGTKRFADAHVGIEQLHLGTKCVRPASSDGCFAGTIAGLHPSSSNATLTDAVTSCSRGRKSGASALIFTTASSNSSNGPRSSIARTAPSRRPAAAARRSALRRGGGAPPAGSSPPPPPPAASRSTSAFNRDVQRSNAARGSSSVATASARHVAVSGATPRLARPHTVTRSSVTSTPRASG